MKRSLVAATPMIGALAFIACAGDTASETPTQPAAASVSARPVVVAGTAPLGPALEARPGPAPGTSALPARIGFDWGPPCRVPAIQDVDQDGLRSRFSFDVVLERREGRLVTTLDNMRVIDMPQSTQQGDAVKRALAAVSGSMPSIAVADTGESQGALDIERTIDAMIALIARTSNDRAVEATVSKLLRSPQSVAAIAQGAGETWDAWVGSWTGLDMAPSTVRRRTYDLPTPVGTLKDVQLTMTHHGQVRDAPELALLSLERTIEGPQLAALLGGLVEEIGKQAGTSMGPVTAQKARKMDRSTAAIDPRLGRPHRALQEMEIQVDDRRQRKTRDTAFDWSRAVGCAPSAADSGQPATQSAGDK